jgi:hypothetical protein
MYILIYIYMCIFIYTLLYWYRGEFDARPESIMLEQQHPSEDLTSLLYRNRQRLLSLRYGLEMYINEYICMWYVYVNEQHHPSKDLTNLLYRIDND